MTAVKVEEQQEERKQCAFSPEGWCTKNAYITVLVLGIHIGVKRKN